MPDDASAKQQTAIRSRVAVELRYLATVLDGQSGDTAIQKLLGSGWRFLKHAFRRIGIWLFSLGVAFYVPVHECGLPYITKDWSSNIMKAGKFSDVFLGVVAMVILSSTDIIDGLILRKSKGVDAITTGSAWTLLGIYSLFIFYGMPAYATTQPTAAPPWTVFIGMLCLGVLAELIIAKSAD